jgi:hypothetical protein
MKTFSERLGEAESFADIFEVVKEGVRKVFNIGRAGLTLGLAELGGDKNFWIGAFYPVGSNIIIVNKTPLRSIFRDKPELFKPYAFHVLLHEYLHSLGFLDEISTRELVYQISRELFGEDHIVTKIARNIEKYLPKVIYPSLDWKVDREFQIEVVKDFDRSNIEYIM